MIAGGVGYGLTASAHAERGQSQDPRTWVDGSGRLKENNIPSRIAMSTPDFAGGQVFIDPHDFYGQLGASADQGPVPVYASREGGDAVGTYDITTGNIVITADNQRGESPAARTRTTVAPADQPVTTDAPTNSGDVTP